MLRRLVPGRAVTAMLVTVAGLVGLGLVGPTARPAAAHGGGEQAEPILERMAPSDPGVTVEVAFSVNYQFVARNTTTQPIAFLADSGEPFLRIGPDGVHGNFASPTFYDTNAPQGATRFPPEAKPGPDVAPIWRKLATEPTWGWYDHRLHPADQFLPPEVVQAGKVAVLGQWKVPFRLGDQPGEIQGRFEYRPPTGTYRMVQKSSQTPADRLTIQVVSASFVPAFFVKNESPDPVVVLGRSDEPFARIGPGVTEVNVKSPTWIEIQQAQGKDPSDAADPTAEPKWQKVADTAVWQWLELRAAAPKKEPPPEVIEEGRAVTVRTWSIPYLIGGRREAIEGITEFVPIAQLRREATGEEDDGGSKLPILAGAGLAAAVLGGTGWLVTSNLRRRRAA